MSRAAMAIWPDDSRPPSPGPHQGAKLCLGPEDREEQGGASETQLVRSRGSVRYRSDRPAPEAGIGGQSAPGPPGCSDGRQHLGWIAGDERVGGDDGQLLHLRLRHQEPIEGIAVMVGQCGNPERVAMLDRKAGNA